MSTTATDTCRERFHDPIRSEMVTLVIPPDGRIFPTGDEPKIGIEHVGCKQLADLSIELDAFYCPACKWNGRVSGAWAVDRIEAHLRPTILVPRAALARILDVLELTEDVLVDEADIEAYQQLCQAIGDVDG